MRPDPGFPAPPPDGAPAGRARRRIPIPPVPLAILLFLATFFFTTTLGPGWTLRIRTDVMTDLGELVTPDMVQRVWSNPTLLRLGLSFSLPVLLILLCHELGHYLTCRRFGLRATPPYFLPLPLALGTLGAFIRIKTPIRSKRELFDVGIAGPIAGFLTLLPFLVYGMKRSFPAEIDLAGDGFPVAWLYLPGSSLGMEILARWFHGPLPTGTVLNLHPFALAAWVGMLVTALNLLPLAQLDGGHVLYAISPRCHRLAGRWLWVALLAGVFVWPGWAIWAVLVLVLGLRHPPVIDEDRPLDARRKALAVLALLIFLFCFMPKPLDIVGLEL